MATNLQRDDILLELEGELECAICLEVFTEPRSLSCYHTYCMSPCLEQMVKSDDQGKYIICPECRGRTNLQTDQTVRDLSRPLPLQKLLKLHERIGKSTCFTESIDEGDDSSVSVRYCELCWAKKVTVQATNFCTDCNMHFCESCLEKHEKQSSFAMHRTQTVVQNTTDRNDPVCEFHDKPCNSYCVECKAIVCCVCVISAHENHTMKDVKLQALRTRGELQKKIDLVNQRKLDHGTVTQAEMTNMIDAKASELEINLTKVEEGILLKNTDVLRKFKTRLDKAAEALILEAQNMTLIQQEKLQICRQQWMDNLSAQDLMLNQIQYFLHNSSDSEVLQSKDNMDAQLATSFDKVNFHGQFQTPTFCPADQVDFDIEIGTMEGDVQTFQSIPLPFVENQATSEVAAVAIAAVFPDLPGEYGLLQIKKLKKLLELKPKYRCYTGLQLNQNTKEIIMTATAKTGLVEQYSYVGGERGTDIDMYPHLPSGLCHRENGEIIAVVCKESNIIQERYKMDGKTKNIISNPAFRWILDIVHVPETNVYAVTDSGAGCVHIVDPTFNHIVSTLTNPNLTKWQPHYIAYHRGNLAVSDVSNGVVTVMDVFGECSQHHRMDRFQPGRLCYDRNGNLIICDTKHGSLVCYYANRPSDKKTILNLGKLGKPYLIDLTEDGTLGIGTINQAENRREIYVFQL